MSKKKIITKKRAQEVGEKLGVDWSTFDVEQFRMGMAIELEHGTINKATNVSDDDITVTGKIALAHLAEFPDYYTRLDKMEKEAKKYWNSK